VGVEGLSASGAGIRGQALLCDTNGCSPTNGDAGQFVAGAGGVLLRGFLANCNGPGCWEEKFKVDAVGNLYTSGNAFKPGGGSWSTLSDVRAKKSVEPIGNALTQLLKLRGVTFEYSDPSAFGELAGAHIGMVAQDVEQAFPSWVDTGTDGYKRLTFRGFEAVAVEAIRDLKSQTDSRMESLKQENAELRRQIAELSEAIRTLTAAR
jgi:hypothetical protein